MGPFIEDKPGHIAGIVKPLQAKSEPLYVVRGSDAHEYAARRYPHKRLRFVHNGARPTSIRSFLSAITWTFQRGQSKGLNATYHFSFRGSEQVEATVVISNERIDVRPGLHGKEDVRIRADSTAWVAFLRRERSLPSLLLSGSLRMSPIVRGAGLLARFGKCFPA